MRADLLPKTFDDKLSRVVEEAGEVLQVIGKYQRYGATPTDPKTGIKYDNLSSLKAELNDLQHAVGIALQEIK